MGKQQEIKVVLRYCGGGSHVNKMTSASVINMETEQKLLDFPQTLQKRNGTSLVDFS